MKREFKIGVFAVAMILTAWAGIRFLKGFDIFSRNVEYYAAYDQINGVQPTSPIMMKGVKIGTVTAINFNPAEADKVVLELTIKKDYHIPSDSEAKIFSNGLMGGKAIEISYGHSKTYLEQGDTLISSRDRDIMDVAGSELEFFKQKISQVTGDLSRTMDNLNRLMEENASNINGTMTHLNSISGDMAQLLTKEKENLANAVEGLSKFSVMMGQNAQKVDSIVTNVNAFTEDLAREEVVKRLSASLESINTLMADIAAGKGTLGKLMNDADLYDSVTRTSDNLAALLADLKKYPGRYVHLSLFGRNPEKMKAKADKQAAKAAAKAERDSLKRLERK